MRKLLETVRNDAVALVNSSRGDEKQTNYIRSAMKSITHNSVPSSWRSYEFPSDMTLPGWIDDFLLRVTQIRRLVEAESVQSFVSDGVWVGGLFSPGAFFTATRQSVAQRNKWALEKLQLRVTVGSSSSSNAFLVKSILLHGAAWNEKLVLSSRIRTMLDCVSFEWMLPNEETSAEAGLTHVVLPLYLNETRTSLLLSVRLNSDCDIPDSMWYQRGVSLSLN